MKRAMFVLLAVSIALAFTCLHLVQQLQQQQALAAGLQEQLAQASASRPPAASAVEPPEQPLAEIPHPTNEPDPVRAMPAMPAMAEAAGDALVGPPPGDAPFRQADLLQEPQYRQALIQRNRLTIPRTLPGVREALGLSEEQAGQLFDLLAQQQVQALERPPLEPRLGQSLDERRRAAIEQRQAMDEQTQAQVRELLGEQTFQRWQDYRATLGMRHQVEQMRTTLARQGVVMEDELVPVLVRALADDQAAWAAQQATPGNARAGVEQRMQLRRAQQERSLQAISPYLTGEQRRVLQEEQQTGLALLEGQMNIMRLQREAAQRGADTGG